MSEHNTIPDEPVTPERPCGQIFSFCLAGACQPLATSTPEEVARSVLTSGRSLDTDDATCSYKSAQEIIPICKEYNTPPRQGCKEVVMHKMPPGEGNKENEERRAHPRHKVQEEKKTPPKEPIEIISPGIEMPRRKCLRCIIS